MTKPRDAKSLLRARVRSWDRAREILQLCDQHGWKVVVGVEEDEPEDIEEVAAAMRESASVPSRLRWEPSPEHQAPPPTAPCPCGSGRRYRKCCMRR
ncbi:MAG: SEC-C domain-containing protein [Candidatus Riflebacteria bacterium]|nr:SEC-C domain-containing protein [Candidatus Riflebacteria bacterium]